MADRAGPRRSIAAAGLPGDAGSPEAAGQEAVDRREDQEAIEEVLESVRPMLQRDHGDVELADVQGKKIYVHLKGACSGCMMEAATLGGIQQKMIETLGELVQVLPSSHMPAEV